MNRERSLPRVFNILLVDDSDDDVLLTRHAFKNSAVKVDFQVARDGCEALQQLRDAMSQQEAVLPNMILLDLNMPRMDGRQLLAELKRDERLKVIPTIVLTTSAADDDVSTAYRNYASSYMIKPIDLHDFSEQTARFVDFWLSDVAVLPRLAKN